jgi:hypothetical protein
MKKRVRLFWLWGMALFAMTLILNFSARQGMAAQTLKTEVVPIDWKRFRRPAPKSEEYKQAAQILNNNARFNLDWMAQTFTEDVAACQYTVPGIGEHNIRPGASAAYGVAVLLKTDSYDEKAAGVSRNEATARSAKLIKGLAATHKSNGSPKGWGDQWQSALWTALLGHAGWMLWDSLDSDAQRMLQTAVAHEADRFIAPDYRVPYWRRLDDRENFAGDTKAEENAWNAMILQAAVAMMPGHTHAAAWKRIGSELMVSAFALRKDAESNGEVVDGRPVKAWLKGYNLREDGAVINHNILHPDYMATPTLNLRAYLLQPLANQAIPETAEFNPDLIYRTFVTHSWTVPPYKTPGGTIYLPRKAEVYYPMGTDWSPFRFDIYYLYDTFAHVRGWDKGLPHRAKDWMKVRSERMLAMQARFPTGSMYAKEEHPAPYPNDQMVAWQMGDALLLLWLQGQNALSPKGKWLN